MDWGETSTLSLEPRTPGKGIFFTHNTDRTTICCAVTSFSMYIAAWFKVQGTFIALFRNKV